MTVRPLTVSFFCPVYKDEGTVRTVAEHAIEMLEGYAAQYEVIIVDDGSPDRSGAIADELEREHPGIVRAIHHPENRGYGAALRTGVAACRFEWLCMVDGDNEYDVFDLRKMLELREFYRLIIGFRYKKLYSTSRVFISFVYNLLLRWVFRSPFRDVSTGIRAFHRSVLDDIELTCDSPFIGAELAIKAMLRGYPVGEVGIQTFPRKLGSGSVMTLRNVLLTMRDVAKVRNRIFSDRYHLPRGRQREETRADG